MNKEGLKFILFLLAILMIPMILYILYIYFASDFYGKSKRKFEKDGKKNSSNKIILLISLILLLIFGKWLLALILQYVL